MLKLTAGRRILALVAALLVAACGTAPAAIDRYDFGVTPARSAGNVLANAGTADVIVLAPVWLDTPSVLYRLGYVDASQLHEYAQTRWVAAPSRLVEQALMDAGAGNAPPACADASTAGRLEVTLQEFSQDFDSPQSSHVILRARARLLAAHSHALIAQRQFDLRAAAATPDGPGAVHGLGELAHAFAASALAWVASCPPAISAATPTR